MFRYLLLLTIFLLGCTANTMRPNDWTRRTFNITPRAEVIGSAEFIAQMSRITKSKLTNGNTAQILQNGENIYLAMLAEIANATTTIDFTVYTFAPDETGREFITALTNAAKRGVNVRVIYDNYGSPKTAKKLFAEFCAAGGKLRVFNPYKNWTFIRANNRCHRKILTIDGRVAFMGGINVSSQFRGENAWHDLMLQVDGLAISEVDQIFAQAWQQAGGNFLGRNLPITGSAKIKHIVELPLKKIVNQKSPPKNYSVQGETPIWVIEQSPEWLNSYLINMYEYAITCAQKNVYLCTPYFIPPVRIRRALEMAKKRGVDVKILTQGIADVPIIAQLSQTFIKQLKNDGVEIYGWRKSILHAKYMLVDDQWLTIGSSNIDGRSLYLNYEANFALCDKKLAGELSAIFLRDIEKSTIYRDDEHQKPPVYLRAIKYQF